MKIRLDTRRGPSAEETAGLEAAYSRLLGRSSDPAAQDAARIRWTRTLDKAKGTVRIGRRRRRDG